MTCHHHHATETKHHAHCGCGSHEHEHHTHCGCGSHEHAHHDHCCCDHDQIENTMDTDWDVSEVGPERYRELFATLAQIKGIKDVNLTPQGLTLTHTEEAFAEIQKAFDERGLKLKPRVDETKLSSRIRIDEMDCPTEEGLIRKKLRAMDGIGALQFDLMNRVLTVAHEKGQLPQILSAIESLGYTPTPLKPEDKVRLAPQKSPSLPWKRLGLGLLLALASEAMELAGLPWEFSLAAALAAIALTGLKTYSKGFIAIRHLNFNMNALMAVAVTGAVLIGSWPEAAMVMVLFELSEAIEQLSLDKARQSIRSLLSLTPEKAFCRNAKGEFVEVAASEIKPGDILRVQPGQRIAVDGTVVEGDSAVDQSPVTGESIPVEKTVGDTVYAGTVNQNGELTISADCAAEDSMPARIIAAIESAQGAKAPAQRFVDKFASRYTPIVFALAIACAVVPPLFFNGAWHEWIYKALTLLVIACPCALVISTPVAIVSGLATAARRGILIKGGLYLERGRALKAIALDKTGTVTLGRPSVLTIEAVADGTSKQEALALAAALAARNSHPMSVAVSQKAQTAGLTPLEVTGFKTEPGQGVFGAIDGTEYYLGNIKGLDHWFLQNQAVRQKVSDMADQGLSALILANPRGIVAWFGLADEIKPTSTEAIRELKALGLQVVMLSGDNEATARRIGQSCGADLVKGALLPNQKQKQVQNMARKHPVGMVGDGINDAPALACADIGFAMGAIGSDAAIETADVALMNDDLRKLPEFIQLSRDTFSILCQNIVFALSIKLLFFVLTLLGLSTMWMAVFADTGTCLIVVANSLRLLRWKKA